MLSLALAQFVVVMNTSVVNIALPSIRLGLGLSPVELTWVINAYVLAFGGLLLAGGRAADVFGRSRVFTVSLAAFGVTSLGAAVAPGAGFLIAFRGLQGIAAAVLSPAALSIALTLYPKGHARSVALAVWGVVSGAGGAAGVIAGGMLTTTFGWRSVFVAALPFVGLSLVMPSSQGTSSTESSDRPTFDVLGAVLVTGALGLLTFSLAGITHHGWLSTRTMGLFVIGALLLVAFVEVERRSMAPLVRLGLFANPSVRFANAAMTLVGGAWLALFFFLPLYQQQVLGYSALRTGLTQLPLAVAIMVASTQVRRITVRLGARTTLVGGLVLLTVGLAGFSRIRVDATFLGHLLGPSLLVGLGLGVAFVELTSLGTHGVAPAESGLASGLVNATRQCGGAMGLALLVSLAASRTGSAAEPGVAALTEGYRTAFLAASVLTGVATLLALRAPRPTALSTSAVDNHEPSQHP
ncbi:Drug resistance transporter EmrB/QacA subfamily [Labilithrix luteola]|uniref:Drug resistance transporter EmrB/QacA subfamily n=1 Tax=Labilithrix luteola TaxID=1391654 RepID=A0A0K1PR80_9BACT|nr:Drug resistance transporter EmrB/QacA subfamily [Labilithrix luteola]